MLAFELGFDGTRRPIDVRHALRTARAGAPVLLEGALVDLGLLSGFIDLFVTEVAALTSDACAAHVRAAGLERMHDVLDPAQVTVLLARLERRATALVVPLARALVEATTAPPFPHYFICSRMFVRVQIPYRLLERYPDLLAAKHLDGHLLPARPHRDFALTHPRHSLSLWCAVGPIREGNTIAVFARDGGGSITPALAPGDVLLFDADSLHASVRNDTDETRVGLGTRVVLGRRLRYGPGTHWRPFYDAQLVDSPLQRFATLQSRLTPAALRRWRWQRRWNREQRGISATAR